MQALEAKVPPPLVAALFGLAMWLLSLLGLGVELATWLRVMLSLLALILGGLLALAGVTAFRRARTTTNPLQPAAATALVTTGVYRVTRNPMYLGFAFFLLALAVWLAFPWSLLGVAGFVLYMDRYQVIPEERALATVFGAEFERYRRRVRRWL